MTVIRVQKSKTSNATALSATVFALCSMLLGPCFSVDAQQTGKIPRIGFLIASSRAVNAAREEAFLQGLRDLGYLEGKNIVIEWRSAEAKLDRLAALAAELVRLKVDVIVTAGPAIPEQRRKQRAQSPLS